MEQQEQQSMVIVVEGTVVEADNSNNTTTTDDSIDNKNSTSTGTIYYGGCHCGNVRYKVIIQHSTNSITGQSNNIIDDCNCSICIQKGYLHYVVERNQFTLLNNIDIDNDNDKITTYKFNTGIAQHKFCNNCGIHSYYIPRSNPNSISINIHCLDEYISNSNKFLLNFKIVPFNGKNWESSITQLHDQQNKTREKQQIYNNVTTNE